MVLLYIDILHTRLLFEEEAALYKDILKGPFDLHINKKVICREVSKNGDRHTNYDKLTSAQYESVSYVVSVRKQEVKN